MTRSARAAMRTSISWAYRSCICRGCPFRCRRERKSGFLFPTIGNTSLQRPGALGPLLLEHRAERRLHVRADRVQPRRCRPRRRPALPHREPARRARLELSALRQVLRRQPQPRAASPTSADLPDDWRLTRQRRERERSVSTSRISPRARKAPAPPSSSAAPPSPTATSTGASTARRSNTRPSTTPSPSR